MELTEVWQRFELSDICFAVPNVGKTIGLPIRLGEDKAAAEIGIARTRERCLRLYLFSKTLHKFGLQVKRVTCSFNADSSRVIVLHKGNAITIEEIVLDSIANGSRKRLNFFMSDLHYKVQSETFNASSCDLPSITVKIDVAGITDKFQCQLMDSESDDPLINLLFLNSFGDVDFHVTGMHHLPVKAPKVILAARSPVLAEIFMEKSLTELDVAASAKTFRNVLNFLIRGRLSSGVNEEVSALADVFEIKTLQEICGIVKAMDPITDILELDSVFDESMMPEESIEKSDGRATLSTFRFADIFNASEHQSGKELRLMTEALVSSKEASSCLIRHVRSLALDWTFPGSVRWLFEDETKQFRFHATLHKDQDESGPFVDITLRNFQRAPTYVVKTVSYSIYAQESLHTNQGQVINGRLRIDSNESQMKRWMGRQSDWTEVFGSNALFEFNVVVETTIPNYKCSMRDLRYSSDLLKVLGKKKWSDVELTIGGKLFNVHRAMVGQTELAMSLYKFRPYSMNDKPPSDPAEAFQKVVAEFPDYLQHALEPVEDFTVPDKIAAISADVFQSVLGFLYGRKLSVSPFNPELLAAAEDLQVKTLREICRACKGKPSDFEPLMQRIEWH